jgi:hypothetical protein
MSCREATGIRFQGWFFHIRAGYGAAMGIKTLARILRFKTVEDAALGTMMNSALSDFAA